MILDQNYQNIARITSEVFRLYSRRVFAEAVKDTYQKRKLLGFDRTANDQIKYGEFNVPIIPGRIDNNRSDDEDNEEGKIKKTLQSVSDVESRIAEKQAVYQVFYEDLVYIAKAEDGVDDLQDKLFLACEMNKVQAWRGVRRAEINMRKYLFKLVHPHEKFGIKQKTRQPFTEHSPVCLLNIEAGKYVKVYKKAIPKKVVGFKVGLTDTISSDTIFYPVKTRDKFVETSKQIFTSSNFKLVLKQNNYFKIDIKEQYKIALIEVSSYKMIANYSGCQLSFLKQNREPLPSSMNQSIVSQAKEVNCYRNYYIRSDTGFYLSSHERKTSSGIKEVTFNMFSEGIGRYNIVVDEFTNNSIQVSEVLLTSPHEHSNNEYKIHSIWQFKKNNLFSTLTMEDGDEVSLMNVATGEFVSCHRSSRKAKLGFTPECYKVSIDDEKYRFKPVEGNILGCRINHAQDRYQLGFQHTDAYFYIEQVDQHTNKVVSKANQIYRVLKNAYKSIWLWGLEREGNKNEVDYNFNRAATDEYLLQIQISNLNEVLAQVEGMLNEEEEEYSSRLGEFQNLIKKSKILEILIYFCKMFIIKMVPIKKSKKATQERTAFTIAKRNIQPTLIIIFGLLRRSSRNNKECSSIIIQFSNLFNSLLTTYPEQVGSLLREAIKNLSILNLNYKGEQLFQWVKLLQKPRKQNIQTLNIYISIVAQVVVDPSDRGIQPYQVKCVQFLFNLHGNMKIKNFLLSFHLNEKEEPIVQFSYGSQKQLLSNNPALQEVACQDEKACCSLVALSNKSKTNPALNNYLIYVYEVVRLYRNLCKDRNKKMSTEMQSIGIKEALIVKIIRSQSIDAKLKMAFLSLYLQIYIDQDPFIPFTKHQNRCIRYQNLPSRDLSSKTYLIFNPSVESVRSSIQLSEFIISFIDGYIATSLTELQSEKTISESICIHVIYIIKFIKTSVDFGYFEANIIIFKIEGLITLLLLLINRIMHMHEYSSYVGIIVQEMGDLLLLYKKMVVQLSILSFIKVCHTQTKEQFTLFTREDTADHAKYLTESYLFLQKRRLKHQDDKQIKQQYKRHSDNPFRKCQEKIQHFLVQILTSLYTLKNKPFYKNLVNLIDCNIQVHSQIIKQIGSLEVIFDKDSAKVADQLNDNQSTRILNANKLEQQVSKLVGEQEITQEQKLSIIIEISNLLRKIIKKLVQYRSKSRRIVNVAQRIIEKNETFSYINRVLKQCCSQKEFRELILIIHQFFYHMIVDNAELAMKLSGDISCIIKVMDSVHMPSLLGIMFPHASNRIGIFKELVETVIFKTHTRVFGFKAIRAVLKSLSLEERKQLDEIVINTILLQPTFKIYLQMKEVTDETRQFVKLLVLLLPNNQQLRQQARDIFPQRDIQTKLASSPYQQKSIYLHLLLHIHLLNPIKKQYSSEHTFIRIILPELENFFSRINQFFDERLLRHMKNNDQNNDPSEVEEKYRKIKETMYDWRVTEFKDHQECVKKRTTKKKTCVVIDQQHNFWEYFYSWDDQKYYLIDFVTEALELGVLRIPNEGQNQVPRPSFLQLKKQNQLEPSPIQVSKRMISQIAPPIEQNHIQTCFIDGAKTSPVSFKQFLDPFKSHAESCKIKPFIRQIACLISRLIIQYNLRCSQISKFNQKMSWICVLLDEPSIFPEDRSLIDRIFNQTELSKCKSSKVQCTFLQKAFYLVSKIFYKKVTVTDIFRVFNVNQRAFIKYSDQEETRSKAQTISRKDFVLKIQELYAKSEFQLVESVKIENLKEQQQLEHANLQQIDYILRTTRTNFFSELYSELLRIAAFKQNYYWFIKKLLHTMRCIKNKYTEELIHDQKKQSLGYVRDYWAIRDWMMDMRGELYHNLNKSKGLKMEEYASKLNTIIRQKIRKLKQSSENQEVQHLFKNFVGIYELHYDQDFMDRFMLVYFQIIHEENIKVNIPISLMDLILAQLSAKHSTTILNIVKMFFVLAKTKFVGAEIEFQKLKKIINGELKFVESRLISATIEQEVAVLQYFKELINVVEAFRELPTTNNKEVITSMSNSLLEILEQLSINNKHPHQIFKITMFYLQHIEENLYLIFNCKSFLDYFYSQFRSLPANIYVTSLEEKQDLYNASLFGTIPRKLRSLKLFDMLEKRISSTGLQLSFLKLMGGYVQWKELRQKAQEKNQISDQFVMDCCHRMLILFQIAYELYHMNFKNFKETMEKDIKYLCLYSQARLRVDPLTKEIKSQSKGMIQYGEELVVEAFEFFIRSNCRIQIIKNEQPVQIFFTKPEICTYFNQDIKEEALKEIDKHHKENLYQYIYQISNQVANSLKIQQSLQSFVFGRVVVNYQKTFDFFMYRLLLFVFIVQIFLQCSQYYSSVGYLQYLLIIVFVAKILFLFAKIINLLWAYCKFKQRWFLSFLNQLRSYSLFVQFLSTSVCLLSCVSIQLLPLAFFFESLLCKHVRQYVQIIIQQYPALLKFIVFVLVACVFGSLMFAYFDAQVERPIEYFTNALHLLIGTKVSSVDGVNIGGENIYLQHTGGVAMSYIFRFAIYLLTFTLMAAFISSSVQTKSKPYLYNCLICLKPKQTFTTKGSAAFKKHIIQEHNFWNYIFYFIHLEMKEEAIKTADDYFVEKCIKEKNWLFLKM